MKNPVIIYSHRRTDGSAIFHSCKRQNKIYEPFAPRYDDNFASVFRKYWLLHRLNNGNTVIKLHGHHLCRFPQSIAWYKKVMKTTRHEIFVVEKDMVQAGLSFLLAKQFGFRISTEIQLFNFTAPVEHIEQWNEFMRRYVQFFPTRGTIITHDNMPEEFFDRRLNTVVGVQQTSEQHQYIRNLEWATGQLHRIKEKYTAELTIKRKVLTIL